MKKVGVFSVRDLRERPEELLTAAELGRLTLIINRGRPAVLAVPFDQRLLEEGVHRGLALSLFQQRQLTLWEAARLEDLSVGAFIDLLARLGVPTVGYPGEEVAGELDAALYRLSNTRLR